MGVAYFKILPRTTVRRVDNPTEVRNLYLQNRHTERYP